MAENKLPTKVLVMYGIGCLGWSIGLNIVSALLNYLYLPPSNSGLHGLIPDKVWLGFVSIISIILFTGRGLDAVIDPLISNFTDKSQSRIGRRIPFMRVAFIPLSICCALIFLPIHSRVSQANIYWLAGTQFLFYFFYGLYTIPYNALLADMGHDDKMKINLSTAQSVGFMVGATLSAGSTMIVKLILDAGITHDRFAAYQYTIVGLNVIAMACLAVPAFGIDEKKYSQGHVSTGGVFSSLMVTLKNSNFRIFALADASYFMSIAIISTGLLFYIKSMLKLDESIGSLFMLGMVAITIIFYALVNWLGTKISKKRMMIASFAVAAVVFSEIAFLGKIHISPYIQATILVVSFGIPNAFLQILPTAVMADITHDSHSSTQDAESTAGMYFGMRAFFQKIGQTGGITLFAMLTVFGKDPGHDLGLRLSGVAGACLCAFSSLIYIRYKEKK
jgi:GPH family glycoside/pentoside/hexuronide:cation symporter